MLLCLVGFLYTTILHSVDKTKFLYTTSPPTQHHSFFRNYPFISLYKLLFSFSHPSLPCFSIKLDYRYSVWVHTWHFALHVAGWVGPLTHHHPLSCGLHHTLQVHISTCHFQPHVTGCVVATLLHCPFMSRVCCCHPTPLPIYVQGVLLPPSFVTLPGVLLPALYCSGCFAATLLRCPFMSRVCCCHFQPDAARCVTATLLHCPFMLRVCCCHPHLSHCGLYHCHPLIAQGVSLLPSLVALQGCCCHLSLC